MMKSNPTFFQPPAADPTKSGIENMLELTSLAAIKPDLFTNTRPLYRHPGARGIYGGSVIAQCLAAAQKTVPESFDVHSLHCYFLLAGDSECPITYVVVRVRDGNSFASRAVDAIQKGRRIFTTSMSFVRQNGSKSRTLQHAIPLPDEIRTITENRASTHKISKANLTLTYREKISTEPNGKPRSYKLRQRIKSAERISDDGGAQAHLVALAFMSDRNFLGTAAVINKLYLSYADQEETSLSKEDREKTQRDLSMIVSLDHSIYFYEPRKFRADEWIYQEMTSPWVGYGRGVVMQHMFSEDGTLIATCYQEGVLRLSEATSKDTSKL
ncbi:Acyl-coenzyme A thioesterase 8 [Golovinomyces cichoracearum]|uniref:Acyl-coenzyme A thioesterase 8 n=1 Tax=Golovinomyces cichoracearum TaxID=62708 RepID=A0A420HSN2_9PEZI|nr:Acyl-coenzyme A thioesterase 8 [Golovinomyces cichoracearum]